MLTYIELILQYVDNIRQHYDYIKPNDQLSDGMIYKFIQLREESTKLSQEFLIINNEIYQSVKLLNGFRNRLTHDYENISYSFLDEIIDSDLPKLKMALTIAKNKMI